MAGKKVVTQTAFSKIAGVTSASISKAILAGLAPALVGRKIDAGHPTALKYMARQKALANLKKETDAIGDAPRDISKVEKYLELTLREILEAFGTDVEFLDWLKSVKQLEEIREKRIKNEVTLGNLISRDYVRTHVFSLIETANVRLLNDSPRTITARILEAKESGESREKIEKLVCDLISVQLKGIKLRARRALQEKT